MLTFGILIFDITQSADIIVKATLTAFLSADLVTSTGSIIPDSIILTSLLVVTSTPTPLIGLGATCSKPALSSIVLKGDDKASSNTLPHLSASIS